MEAYLFLREKRLIYYTLILLVVSGCNQEKTYPKYSLGKISYIPDSLKSQHRTWITQTTRSAGLYMTSGTEDASELIIQVKHTADELFQASVLGLKKEIDYSSFNDVYIKPWEFNEYEKQLFDSLKINN